MSSDRDKELRFECLRCGKVSPLERAIAIQPKCGRCGSGTGVVGDIGQGSQAARQRRLARARGASESIRFECLRCGAVTNIGRIVTTSFQCMHCGARDGVVVESDA